LDDTVYRSLKGLGFSHVSASLGLTSRIWGNGGLQKKPSPPAWMSISRHELGSSRSLNLRIGFNALHSPATESGRSWFRSGSRCKPVLVFGVAFRSTRWGTGV